MSDKNLGDRKLQHIGLTSKSQVLGNECDSRFNYEPLFGIHQDYVDLDVTNFGEKVLDAPIWVSSMTGGTGPARHINQNLAKACAEFGLGMGLGSCRPLLESDEFFEDFNLRPIIGDKTPFFANLGIAQIEQALKDEARFAKVLEIVERLRVDGLIIHINPLQEIFQPEGDRIERPPLETLTEFLGRVSFPVIVKEVGQGMGPKSLEALMRLPLHAIEFGAFGGTNFSKLEILRAQNHISDNFQKLAKVGHTAKEMVVTARNLKENLGSEAKCQRFIVSGGVRDFLDGFWLINELGPGNVYGMAKPFLDNANKDYETLREFVKSEVEGLKVAKSYLFNKGDLK